MMNVREYQLALLFADRVRLVYRTPEQAELQALAIATYLRPLDYLVAPLGAMRDA